MALIVGQTVAYLHIQQTWSNISFYLETFFLLTWHTDSPISHLLFALFWFSPIPEGNISIFSCYVRQLVDSFVCQPFGGWHVVYGLAFWAGNMVDESSKTEPIKTHQKPTNAKTLGRPEGNSGNSLVASSLWYLFNIMHSHLIYSLHEHI